MALGWRALASTVLLAVTAAGGLASAQPASAATPTGAARTGAARTGAPGSMPLARISGSESPPSDRLSGVSCPGRTFCLAVGTATDAFGHVAALAEAWNGTRWRQVSDPAPGDLLAVSCRGPRFCMAVGTTLGAGARAMTEIWNGSSWRIVPAGVTGTSYLSGVSCPRTSLCLAVGAGRSGDLAEAWNGTRWRTLATRVACGRECGLAAVSCATARNCVAAGFRTDPALEQPVSDSLAWNGTKWREVAPPAPGGTSQLAGVACASASYCVAVGRWQQGQPACDCTLGAVWNGTAWSQLPTPSAGSGLSAVSCPGTGLCVGVGGALALAWRGRTWAPLPVAQPGGTARLGSVSCWRIGACMAVGSYATIDGAQLTLAEQWDGRTWRIRPTANPGDTYTGLAGVSCPSARDCMAVGSYISASDRTVTLAERWNGRTWQVLPTANPGAGLTVLTAVSCRSAGDCVAVGYFDQAGGRQALAERWNGSRWLVEGVPHRGALTGVSCASRTSCLAVGSYLGPNDRFALTASWDGTAWTVRASPAPGGTLTEFTGVWCVTATDCLAVGDYNVRVASPLLPLAARWDGTAWRLMSAPAPATGSGGLAGVSCAGSSMCVAVGSRFSRHGRAYPVGTLAETWNGSRWRIAATPAVSCPSPARCLAVGGRLTASGQLVPLALTWNGSGWRTLSVPAPGHVLAELNAISCSRATWCVAVGVRGGQRSLMYYWNGARWATPSTRRS